MAARLLTLALAVLAVAAPASTQAAAPTAGELLQQYEPVLLFHPAEDWVPQAVGSFLAQARVERQAPAGTWSAVPPPLPTSNAGCTASPCYRLNLPCRLRSGYACYHRQAQQQTDWAHPVVYGTAAPVAAGTPPPPGITGTPKLLLHYWLFYAVDDWHSSRARLWQLHEADWESITVGLDANDAPLFAAYSEHCSGSVRPWTGVTLRGGSHPVAYVALGSHANWFSATKSDTRFAECVKGGVAGAAAAQASALVKLAQDRVVDRMGSAHASGPAGPPGVTPLTLVELKPAATPWARFPGRWSEGQILWLGSTPHRFTTVSQGFGPGTPRWFAATVSASWHPATG